MNTKSLLVGLVAAMFVLAVTMPVFAECWAALAINQGKRTAAVGTGPTLSEAQLAARNQAGSPGSSIWSWGRGIFIAMAADQNNPDIFGIDGGTTQQEADQKAVAYCQKMGGQNCKVVTRGGCGGGQDPQQTKPGWQQPDQTKPGPSPNPLPVPDDQKFKW